MAPSTTKKVVLYRWDRPPAQGMVNPAAYLSLDHFEWMTTDGRLQICPLADCKILCFVSESGQPDLFTVHNVFERRPRIAGLWTRFLFRDGGVLEGVLSPNLLDWPDSGYFATPPQARASRQRVFVPRTSLVSTELRGVIGGTSRSVPKKEQADPRKSERQLSIFE